MNETNLAKPLFKSNKTMAWMVALGSLITVAARYCSNVIFGVMLKPLADTFGVPLPTLLIVTTCIALGTLALSTFITPLTLKWNPKYLSVLGGVFIVFFFYTMINGTSLYLFWIGGALYGMSNLLCGPLMNQTMANHWFKSGVAKIMGWTMTIGALTTLVFPPLAVNLFTTRGIAAVGILGCILGGVIVVASLVLYPNKLSPSAYGMEPTTFGTDSGKQKELKEKQDEIYPKLNMPVSRIMKMPVLWIILAAHFIIYLGMAGYSTNESVIILSMGVDMAMMGYLVSVGRISQSLTQFLFGYLSDRFSPKNAFTIMLCIPIIMHLINFSFKLKGNTAAICLVFFCTFSYVALYYAVTMLPRFFGREKGSFFIGWSQTVASIAIAIAAPVSALVAEKSGGTYFLVSLFMAILLLVNLIITRIIYRKKVFDMILEIDKEYAEK